MDDTGFCFPYMQDISFFWRIYILNNANLGCDGIMGNDKRDNRKASVEVSILGESLIVAGNSSTDYIEAVAEFVNDQLTELQYAAPRMSRTKIIALGAMNLADELIKANQNIEMSNTEIAQLRKEKDELRKEIEKLQIVLEDSEKRARHYQEQYKELELLLEQEG